MPGKAAPRVVRASASLSSSTSLPAIAGDLRSIQGPAKVRLFRRFCRWSNTRAGIPDPFPELTLSSNRHMRVVKGLRAEDRLLPPPKLIPATFPHTSLQRGLHAEDEDPFTRRASRGCCY